MSVLYALAWRLLQAVLYTHRALLLVLLRCWNWRLWRAAAALLVPAELALWYRRGGRRDCVRRCDHPRHCRCSEPGQPCECQYLQCERPFSERGRSDVSGLAKLPVHMALLISEEHESYTDVANLVVWCMAVGISYVSVYDHQGIFKQNSSRLMDEVLKQQKKLLDHEYCKYPLEYANGSIDKTGKAFSHLPILKMLSADDGKAAIGEAAQRFCQLVAEEKKKPSDMDVHVLDRLLRNTHKFPDPDLILKFGNVASTLGFLPWHIRLSEIICIPTHVNICYEDFYSALRCYAGCEQRLGK
ncbi:dehydrodolichyl diphosphate synthase complex subunit NUS1 [Pelobates cultripes]|uniref:ditrans,polycis-polyprenyl diphosphate synthase [(2E,6E)-farnesyldiphosphate specific] n=1 Tax=Pelobates cultripes TaxID=61616 RepID=A0AAD1RFF6_PELCU|nr:dehydrodolichyl diphosphate synthase complex subunit NUS1 [Pelobates cultripes]